MGRSPSTGTTSRRRLSAGRGSLRHTGSGRQCVGVVSGRVGSRGLPRTRQAARPRRGGWRGRLCLAGGARRLLGLPVPAPARGVPVQVSGPVPGLAPRVPCVLPVRPRALNLVFWNLAFFFVDKLSTLVRPKRHSPTVPVSLAAHRPVGHLTYRRLLDPTLATTPPRVSTIPVRSETGRPLSQSSCNDATAHPCHPRGVACNEVRFRRTELKPN